jgi:hypothetical protein
LSYRKKRGDFMVDLKKSTCTGCKYYETCGEAGRKEPCAGKETSKRKIDKLRSDCLNDGRLFYYRK